MCIFLHTRMEVDDGRRGVGHRRNGPEKVDPVASRPSGGGDHVRRMASPPDRRITGGKGTQGETAQGKGGLTTCRLRAFIRHSA